MVFGAGLFFVLLQIAYPSSFIPVTEISEIPHALSFAFTNTFNRTTLFTTWTPILIAVAIFLCPYMHMSWSDVKGATSGAVMLILLAIIVSFISAAISVDMVNQVQVTMNTLVTYYIFALLLGLIVNIAVTVFFCFLSIIRGR
jgi:hypothetical protein